MLLLPFLLPAGLMAQDEYPITDGQTVTACFGTFTDDGTEAAYTGAQHTFTICPDVPGDVVQIDFIGFALQTSPNPNNSDVLQIFQGDTPGAPAAGAYFGSDLAGLTITGNTANLTGCLTFVFTSPTGNTNGLPGWVGNISCTTPCDAPTQNSSITSPPLPNPAFDSVSVCIGDVISFSAAGSQAAPGFTIDQYIWNFQDGTGLDSLSGANVDHIFNEAGEYLVTLTVEDNNGCQSPNISPLDIIVSTLPDVTLDYPTESCIGETFTMSSNVEGITWTALPPISVGGETYLADDLGFDFESTLVFDFFEPDQTLDNCLDLEEITINMVHSYLGDLEMIIECPDGTQVTLHEFGSGGGGTFLGEANDPGTAPGVGYDYGWSPTSTLGFFHEAANETSVSYTNADGNNVTQDIVNPGIYESQNDLCDLVGCPLNGTWTFVVTDNLGIDDGYIFEWGINLNPELFPGVTTFTPQWGQLADSSSWGAGDFIDALSPDGNTITVSPTAPGTYDYTFSTLNDFGCTFDTTVTVTVLEPLSPNAGEDSEINCDEPYQLNTYLNATPSPTCEYEIVLQDNFLNGWNGGELEVIIDGNAQIFTINAGGNTAFPLAVNHQSSIEIYYTAGALDLANMQDPAHNQYMLRNANGDLIFVDGEFGVLPTEGLAYQGTALCFPPEPSLSYSWTPVENLNNPSSQNPIVSGLVETTTFTVEVWQPNHPDCRFSDEVTLVVSGALSAGEDIAECGMSYQLSGTSIPNGEWQAPAGSGLTFSNPTSGNSLVTATDPGTYTITWNDLDGLSCPNSSAIDVTFFNGIDIQHVNTEPFCHGQCTGEILLTGTGGNVAPASDYVYSYSAGNEGVTPNEIIDLCFGNHTITLQDNDSCASTVQIFMDQPPAPIIDSVVVERESCLGACDGTMAIYSDQAVNYSFDNGVTFGTDSTHNALCGGFHDIRISDPNGCEANMEVLVPSPIAPEAVFIADPVRTGIFDPLIQFTNFSTGNHINSWTFGIDNEVGTSEEINPAFLFPSDPGVYTVQLLITDSIGCVDSSRVDIEIMDEFQIFVPTAFSPNDDGINDFFHLEIQDLDPTNYSFQIFDRWGDVVYTTTEYPTRWNGQGLVDQTYYVPDGIYIWHVKARSASTTKKLEKMGTVTVIR